jgi:transcriptional regulator with XRE-family HTH domain
MIIGKRLRCLREQKNLSQGDIEVKTGLLRCYISRVENGHTVPVLGTLEKWARALEVPLYQLFYGDEKPREIPELPKRRFHSLLDRADKIDRNPATTKQRVTVKVVNARLKSETSEYELNFRAAPSKKEKGLYNFAVHLGSRLLGYVEVSPQQIAAFGRDLATLDGEAKAESRSAEDGLSPEAIGTVVAED